MFHTCAINCYRKNTRNVNPVDKCPPYVCLIPGSCPKYRTRVHFVSLESIFLRLLYQIAKFMGPTWSPPGSSRPQMEPMLASWTLLSGMQGCPVRDIMPITRFTVMRLVKRPIGSDIFGWIYVFGLHFLFDLFLQRNLSINWLMHIDSLFNGSFPEYMQCATSAFAHGKCQKWHLPLTMCYWNNSTQLKKMWNCLRLFNIYFRIRQHQTFVSIDYDQAKLGCAYIYWN